MYAGLNTRKRLRQVDSPRRIHSGRVFDKWKSITWQSQQHENKEWHQRQHLQMFKTCSANALQFAMASFPSIFSAIGLCPNGLELALYQNVLFCSPSNGTIAVASWTRWRHTRWKRCRRSPTLSGAAWTSPANGLFSFRLLTISIWCKALSNRQLTDRGRWQICYRI